MDQVICVHGLHLLTKLLEACSKLLTKLLEACSLLLTKLLEACSLLLTKLLNLSLDRREPLLDRREPLLGRREPVVGGNKLPVNKGSKARADSDDKGGVVLRHGSCSWNVMIWNGGVVRMRGRGVWERRTMSVYAPHPW